ncbi:hypothetical protein MGMO_105c00380 [Methyloglobulus morosus KoM1]|uniref:DUF3014 domain-containing protein n=1 Tax=Methyloglobulus morosus KoM1 TaxID=1116472 RepID=V5DVF5_9GAMM|nr:DUF3014 domain-containing protein [Methyloglobulus morosus]ESS71386.1 hypothetical protein MGMO_105c00380 [Methyloglobulus morosus KoM1]
MGRYDQNRNKKSNNTAFIIAILVSLLTGISGTYYILTNFELPKEAETTDLGIEPTNKTTISKAFPDEQKAVNLSEPLPPAKPEILVRNNDKIPAQQDGLPDLLGSDNYVRQTLASLFPGLAQWLNTDRLIRRYVEIINDFAQGTRIVKHVSFLRFDEYFTVAQDENGLYIAPKSFARYNNLAQTIHAIDVKAAVAVYQKLRPLMLQVFAEFNYPDDITLENIVNKAAGEIIATPVLDGNITLVRPSVFYKFADPKLEALNPVQKQMLRMGAENTRLIQNKCREFLVELARSDVKAIDYQETPQ